MVNIHLIRCVFITFLLCAICSIVHSQEREVILKDIEEVKDPFISQLPEPVIVPKQPVAVPVEVVPQNVAGEVPVPIPIVAPRIPDAVQNTNMSTIVLQGLVWNSDTPQVIINNRVMSIGDNINGMQIVAISRDGVEFSSNGVTTFLKVSAQKGAVAVKP